MTVALRTTGVPSPESGEIRMERFREIRVSSVSYRAKGPVHSKLQQYNYEIHPGARDHSHMCDNKVHAQAACAPDRGHEKHGKSRAAATARDRFARTPPNPGQIARASRAVHDDMRDVLGLPDAPAQ